MWVTTTTHTATTIADSVMRGRVPWNTMRTDVTARQKLSTLAVKNRTVG